VRDNFVVDLLPSPDNLELKLLTLSARQNMAF